MLLPLLKINYSIVEINYWFLVSALVSMLYFFDSAVSSHSNRLISKNVHNLFSLTDINKAYITSLAILLGSFILLGLLPVLIISAFSIFAIKFQLDAIDFLVFILAAFLCAGNLFTAILHASGKIYLQKRHEFVSTVIQFTLAIFGILLQWRIEIIFAVTIAGQFIHHFLNMMYINKNIVKLRDLYYFDRKSLLHVAKSNIKNFINTFIGVTLGYGLYHFFSLALVYYLKGDKLLAYQFTLRIILFVSQFLQVLVYNKLPNIINVYIASGFPSAIKIAYRPVFLFVVGFSLFTVFAVMCSFFNIQLLGYYLVQYEVIVLLGVIILFERLVSFMMLIIVLDEQVIVHKVVFGNILLITFFTTLNVNNLSSPNTLLQAYLFALLFYATPYSAWKLVHKH